MLERDFEQRDSSEHEIRCRPTDRREVIKRIFYCTRISRITLIFYTRFFEHESHELNEYFCTRISHTDLTHGFLFAALRSRFLNTNRTNYTNNLLHTDLTFLKHTDLTDLTDLPMLRMAHGCHFLSYITNPRIP